ncbi:hypothetical protein LSCM1_08023 [Leishmania martiniquensis]|uniref:BRCT domain-containing protein n=1 Tax=Leishmania martiniquensis TaxID=1580590 RepID=A0A836HID0_9TRYP|nr:hypothetical protein LSCM1_08023 [Leishmania martiniquensis]
MSLTDVEEAETVELLSEDSCSTVSTSCQDVETTAADSSLPPTANTDEERLRRDTLHECFFVPELRPQSAWLEEGSVAGNESPACAREIGWDVAHADHLIVPVRWRVALASPETGSPTFCTTLWVPFAVPLVKVITTGTATTADTANTTSTTSSSRSGSSGATLHPLGSVQLSLGRSMFLFAVKLSARVPWAWGNEVGHESLASVAASVSRAQCTLHLHYSVVKTPQAPSSLLSRPVCRSFDVFPISPTTSLLGVALQPHQRYHIKRRRGAGKSAYTTEDQPCDVDGVLTLRVGPYCHVDVALDGVPLAPCASAAARPPPAKSSNSFNGVSAHTPLNAEPQDAPAVYRRSTCRSGAARERLTDATQLRRGSATSLVTSDSTAVLATLSDVSDFVALSGTSDPEYGGPVVSGGEKVAVTSLHTLVTGPSGEVPPEARKRRRPAAARQGGDADAVEDDEDNESVPAAPPDATVLYTTGVRLSAAEEKRLKGLGALVNPHLRLARYARVLVAQRPLMRSVKLLTVLPYVHEVVHQSWLDAVRHTRNLDLPTEGFAYTERRVAGSIESENSFSLRETLNRAPAERQRLFAQQRFWVHHSATPQEPPMNDLKTVLVASGGIVTRRILDADVLVLPSRKPSLLCWRGIAQQLGGGGTRSTAAFSTTVTLTQHKKAGLLLVIPDDIFKCVLQQRPLSTSSVALPRQLLTMDATIRSSTGAASGGRRSSQGARKIPRASTTQRSSRPRSQKRTH